MVDHRANFPFQVQTPTQRKANVKFAKLNESKMGKPESAIKRNVKQAKPTISPFWLGQSY